MNKFGDQPFTLSLSSGFFGFYAHVGFLKALKEFGLKPAAYAGSSAGAIVGAAAARGLSIKEIENMIRSVSRKEIWDPYPGFGFLRGEKFQNLLEKEIGSDFSELKLPMRIAVFDIISRSTKIFTTGDLARVIRASCAVPVMFHPVRIEKRFYWDGGVKDKMGIHGLELSEKILCHYLVGSKNDAHSIYELNRDQKLIRARGKNLVQVQLLDLPRAHPFAMDRGSEIIHVAYKKALTAFKNTI